MSLEQAIQAATGRVPECVAIGYVDMTTGMLMSGKSVDTQARDVLELLAAATVELFRGPGEAAIETMFRPSRGVADDGRRGAQEIIVFSDNLLHVFMRGRTHQNHATVFVCRASAPVGAVLAEARVAIGPIEGAV